MNQNHTQSRGGHTAAPLSLPADYTQTEQLHAIEEPHQPRHGHHLEAQHIHHHTQSRGGHAVAPLLLPPDHTQPEQLHATRRRPGDGRPPGGGRG